MVKIAYGSDLHLEHGYLDITNEQNADLLILAGDILPISVLRESKHKNKYLEFFAKVAQQFKEVILVAGNHEFYGSDFKDAISHLREALSALPNIHILDNQAVDLYGVVFIGSTLWTDFNKDPVSEMTANREMSDFKAITNSNHPVHFRGADGKFHIRIGKMSVDDVIVEHNRSKAKIAELAHQYVDRLVVVISHHGPTTKSIHPRYAGDPLNGAFSSDQSELILDNPNIKFWIHGHTHDPFDYYVGDTRVMCNPRGYPHENTSCNFSINHFEVN